jgi:mono/diheme cytochrome c family protein
VPTLVTWVPGFPGKRSLVGATHGPVRGNDEAHTIDAVRDTRVLREGTRLRRGWLLVFGVVFFLVLQGAAASATDEGATTEEDPRAELLRQGQEVYDANCVACHQADGGGLAGAFPPLLDNPRVLDETYVAGVVRNGLTGELEVNGEVYNGAMPAFQLLDDAQVEAVAAFVANGLTAPAAEGAEVAAGDVAGTELPIAVVITYGIGFLLFLVVAALVAAPYVLAKDERHIFDWPRAWLKALAIFLGVTILTVVIPNLVLQNSTVSGSPRLVQDLIGSGVWFVALALTLWALRRGQRDHVL